MALLVKYAKRQLKEMIIFFFIVPFLWDCGIVFFGEVLGDSTLLCIVTDCEVLCIWWSKNAKFFVELSEMFCSTVIILSTVYHILYIIFKWKVNINDLLCIANLQFNVDIISIVVECVLQFDTVSCEIHLYSNHPSETLMVPDNCNRMNVDGCQQRAKTWD